MGNNNHSIMVTLIMIAAGIVALGLIITSSGGTAKPTQALETLGFTDIRVEPWSIFGCGENELAYNASAVNSAGTRVNVVVCCDAMSPCTVRSR